MSSATPGAPPLTYVVRLREGLRLSVTAHIESEPLGSGDFPDEPVLRVVLRASDGSRVDWDALDDVSRCMVERATGLREADPVAPPPPRDDGMLIAFGEQREHLLYVRDGRGWYRSPATGVWAPLETDAQLPGLGGWVLTGARKREVLATVGEPT